MNRMKSQLHVIGSLLVLSTVFVAGRFLWLQRTSPGVETATPAAQPVPEQEEGGAAVQLSPEEQRKIGVEVSDVRRETLNDEIAAIGRVAEAESALRTVSSRYGGRVAHLFVNFTGQPVAVGDPIATITITGQPIQKDEPFSTTYSPGLIAAREEYQFALENQQHAHASSRPDAIAQADALVAASRIRLERWGLTSAQVEGVGASSEQPIQITVNSTASGIVRARKVTEGQFVTPGDVLIELTDLGRIWVMADVFDTDIARIRPGMDAQLTSEALPNTKLRGEVTFIESRSDPQSRTTPVRIQVENPGNRLRPGMVVQTSFELSLGSTLSVPQSAVIDSGKDKTVYVAHDNGVFERRTIQIGSPVRDRYPILDGLKSGDKVVSNGAFLIDSQTKLTGGLTGMFGGSKSFADTAPASGYKTTFRMDPDPPAGGKENTVHVSVMDSAGKPVSDAQVRMTLIMPAMPAMGMPEMRSNAELKWNGTEYTGPIQILMAGPWSVVVEARRGNQPLAVYRTNLSAR
jgi:RND family efflux transporter MFP subunit